MPLVGLISLLVGYVILGFFDKLRWSTHKLKPPIYPYYESLEYNRERGFLVPLKTPQKPFNDKQKEQ